MGAKAVCWRPGDWPLRLLHNGQPVLRQAVVSNKYFLFKQPISPPIWFAAVAIVGADKPLIFGLASIGLPFLLSMATPCKKSESCPAAITDTRPIAIVVFAVMASFQRRSYYLLLSNAQEGSNWMNE